MAKNKNGIARISFANMDAEPDEVKVDVGVAGRFNTPEYQKAIEERQQKQEEQPVASAETIAERVDTIAGSKGTVMLIERAKLNGTRPEWNQFSAVNDEKKALMAESIHEVGLLQPIIVWATDESNEQFEILAGNTRNELYGILYDTYHDDKYLSIEARVYAHDQLTEDQAREIASDTNYLQRGSLNSDDKAFAIKTKVELLNKRGKKGALQTVAEQMNLKRTSIYHWLNYGKAIPKFRAMFNNGQLTLKAVSRLGTFSKEAQEGLVKYADVMTNALVMKVPAQTPDSAVVAKFEEALEAVSAPVEYAGSMSVERKENETVIRIAQTFPEDTKPVVVALPPNKLEAFLKKYHEFIYN